MNYNINEELELTRELINRTKEDLITYFKKTTEMLESIELTLDTLQLLDHHNLASYNNLKQQILNFRQVLKMYERIYF